jgi:hypothetical protein
MNRENIRVCGAMAKHVPGILFTEDGCSSGYFLMTE